MQKVVFITLLLAGCSSGVKHAWEHYDECSGQSFVAMVDCGKAKRTAMCLQTQACDAAGNSIVLYADSLAASVKAGSIAEPEAQRRWIEFKMARSDAERSVMLQRAALSGTVCHTSGATTICN
jgi:hypothetical protein